jgi:hypothetical protein
MSPVRAEDPHSPRKRPDHGALPQVQHRVYETELTENIDFFETDLDVLQIHLSADLNVLF